MIVVSLSLCPPSLRGDVTKWLMEVDTGVYVGRVSARVREELWKRICNNIGTGRAIMVYNAQNVQGYEIKTHNTRWKPIDYDGVTLVQHPNTEMNTNDIKKSRVNKKTPDNKHTVKNKLTDENNSNNHKWNETTEYVVIDLETTGLDFEKDKIIELAAIKVSNGFVVDSISKIITIEESLPKEIIELTGITDQMISQGEEASNVLDEFLEFTENSILISHNSKFDLHFLYKLCDECGRRRISNTVFDTLKLSRRYLRGLDNYKLITLASAFDIDISDAHRAMNDAIITMKLFEELKKTVKEKR